MVIEITLPDSIVAEVNEFAKSAGLSRSAWIRMLVLTWIHNKAVDEQLKNGYLQPAPEFVEYMQERTAKEWFDEWREKSHIVYRGKTDPSERRIDVFPMNTIALSGEHRPIQSATLQEIASADV